MKKELIKIRKADKKDLFQLKRLCLVAHKELAKFNKDMMAVNTQTEKEASQEVNLAFKDPFRKIFVAEKKGRIVGNVHIFFAPGLRKEGTIFNLFVIKSARRKGIASRLLTKAIDWSKKQKIKKVIMVIHKNNEDGLFFLKKFGFKKEPITVFWLTKSI